MNKYFIICIAFCAIGTELYAASHTSNSSSCLSIASSTSGLLNIADNLACADSSSSEEYIRPATPGDEERLHHEIIALPTDINDIPVTKLIDLATDSYLSDPTSFNLLAHLAKLVPVYRLSDSPLLEKSSKKDFKILIKWAEQGKLAHRITSQAFLELSIGINNPDIISKKRYLLIDTIIVAAVHHNLTHNPTYTMIRSCATQNNALERTRIQLLSYHQKFNVRSLLQRVRGFF